MYKGMKMALPERKSPRLRDFDYSLALHNNQVDYIVTHTAPREMILRMGYNPDVHDLELTGFLEYILYEVSHTHWYCGHWHDDKDITDKFTVLWHEIRNEDNIVR